LALLSLLPALPAPALPRHFDVPASLGAGIGSSACRHAPLSPRLLAAAALAALAADAIAMTLAAASLAAIAAAALAAASLAAAALAAAALAAADTAAACARGEPTDQDQICGGGARDGRNFQPRSLNRQSDEFPWGGPRYRCNRRLAGQHSY
jgi:hypothetical protein